jgi:hypothetical protein
LFLNATDLNTIKLTRMLMIDLGYGQRLRTGRRSCSA